MTDYVLISDTHHHNWSAFATINQHGVNSRLATILNETARAALEALSTEDKVLVHAGDLFHVRGSVAPTVLNPTLDLYRDAVKNGVKVFLIPGNHDLESKDAARVSSAVTALEAVGCTVIDSWEKGLNALDGVVMVPWFDSVAELKKCLEAIPPAERIGKDLVIHAPIDDVIVGIPSHGLTADYLASLGFHNVLAGHYHNHKEFKGGVYSIGALCHHSWSDVGSTPGFVSVIEGAVQHHGSYAPKFVEIDSDTDPDDYERIVNGNYARVKIGAASLSDIEEIREHLTNLGALGIQINSQPEVATPSRTGSTVKSGASLETSVSEFVRAGSFNHAEEVIKESLAVLSKVKGASA